VLQPVPVYVVLNGQGEIVLANSTDSSTTNASRGNQIAYDFCGNFDSLVSNETQLGLFFMSKADAEVYLQEFAKLDPQGTKSFGLSIHCFGLDFAYRVMREYHPKIDFRFIPDLAEVQTLMTPQSTGDSNLIFENSQQQLRVRRRPLSFLPFFKKLSNKVSPFSSFIEKTDYFKGVPIYIVQTTPTSASRFVEGYFNTLNLFDTFVGRIINSLGFGIGFGNNWILQGSLQEQKATLPTKTYVFFEQTQARDFCRQFTRQVTRYKSTHATLFDKFTKQPKILVYNLEDFLESYEDRVIETNTQVVSSENNFLWDFKTLNFVSPKRSTIDMEQYSTQSKHFSLRKVTQFFSFKYRRLSGFFGLLLNTN